MKRTLLTITILLAGSTLATANMPAPLPSPEPNPFFRPPTPPRPALVRVEISNQSEVTRLLIPRRLLANLQTAALPAAPEKARSSVASLPTLMIGLALTAGFTFGGFCLVKKPRLAVRVGALLLVAALLVPGVLGIATATPPGYYPPAPHPMPPQRIAPYTISGPMFVEIVDEGDSVRLLLHKDTPLVRVPMR